MVNANSLRDAILAAGMHPPEFIPCGTITRFPGAGKKSSNRAGWCWRSDDGDAASYGDYSTGLRDTWQADSSKPLSPTDWQTIRELQRKRIAADEARYKSRAVEVQQIWAELFESTPCFMYFVAKQIEAFAGLFRTHIYKGSPCVVAPLEYRGQIVNLQHISPSGGKWPYPGARWIGAYCVVQRLSLIHISEPTRPY